MTPKQYNYQKDIVCTDSLQCSNKIVKGLENKTGFKLHAGSKTEIGLEGSVTIYHLQNNHHLHIELYRETINRLKQVIDPPTFEALNLIILEVLTEETKQSLANRILNFIRRTP